MVCVGLCSVVLWCVMLWQCVLYCGVLCGVGVCRVVGCWYAGHYGGVCSALSVCAVL